MAVAERHVFSFAPCAVGAAAAIEILGIPR
jgi:hypothetical protein